MSSTVGSLTPRYAARRGCRAAFSRVRDRLLGRADDGTSAIEFALVAPVLILALLATADVGLALYIRMTIDHVLRIGAQTAMGDPGEPTVLEILNVLGGKDFILAEPGDTLQSGSLLVGVDRYCACPEEKGTAVACTASCTGADPPFAYYRLSAQGRYDGILIPSIDFSPVVQVQVR